MALQSDQGHHVGVTSGQLALFGVAALVLLVFAWTYLN
jgi:hypothetical protein